MLSPSSHSLSRDHTSDQEHDQFFRPDVGNLAQGARRDHQDCIRPDIHLLSIHHHATGSPQGQGYDFALMTGGWDVITRGQTQPPHLKSFQPWSPPAKVCWKFALK